MLAHRGRHWILLQNVCRDMLNAVQLATMLSHVPDKVSSGDILDLDDLKSVLWHPLYMAADLLLDMLQQTEDHLNYIFRVSLFPLLGYNLFYSYYPGRY